MAKKDIQGLFQTDDERIVMMGKELKSWREQQGKSQMDLAKKLDVSRHSIIKWEQAERVPRLVELAIRALDQEKPLLIGRPSSTDEVSNARKLFDMRLGQK